MLICWIKMFQIIVIYFLDMDAIVFTKLYEDKLMNREAQN